MDKIGRYRLDRRLGAGSFATVWLGYDDELQVPVAVKVLAENWASNDDVRNRFLGEARIMRRIQSPRIVQVYDIGSLPDGRPYFVMDFIDGGSMNDLRKQLIDPVRALRLCAEGCRAIEVLHENDVIHRDVTPGNLLLKRTPTGEPRVLVADLGVAKSMADVAGATMTAGTPSYMAFEQAAGIVPLDRRADIYSLTAVTYAMLTGSPPFQVRSIADIVSRDRSLAPAPIAARIGAPPILDALMVSGLSADPNRRPPTAALLADALDGVAAQMDPSLRGREPAPEPMQPAQVQASPVESRFGAAAPPLPSYGNEGSGYQTGQSTGSNYSIVPGFGSQSQPPQPVQPYPSDPRPPKKRGTLYYVLVGLAALALFVASMFITIALLQNF